MVFGIIFFRRFWFGVCKFDLIEEKWVNNIKDLVVKERRSNLIVKVDWSLWAVSFLIVFGILIVDIVIICCFILMFWVKEKYIKR